MTTPLYGFLEGDTLGLLLVAVDDERVGSLSRRLEEAASLRVAVDAPTHVVHRGRTVDPRLTVAQAGFEPFDRFDVRRGSG
jgi:hypothetical protein